MQDARRVAIVDSCDTCSRSRADDPIRFSKLMCILLTNVGFHGDAEFVLNPTRFLFLLNEDERRVMMQK